MNQIETNQATLHIFKDETIEIEEHFYNIDVKHELDEEVHSVNVINDLNGETNAISSIKQEVNVDLNTDLIIEECNASIKQESNIDNIENKLNHSNGKQEFTELGEPQSCVEKKLNISEDNDVEADFSDDDGTSQNEIKKRRKIQNKIRCKRYRDKKKFDAIFGSSIYKNPIDTVEEEEKIKRRKEYNKQKSKRYRDRKRAINLYKVVRNVSTCQKTHNSQIADSSTRNEPYILKSHSDYDHNICNYIASQVNHHKNNKNADALVGSLIYKNRIITVEEEEKIKGHKDYNKQKCRWYRDRKRVTNFINLQTNQSSKTDIHNDIHSKYRDITTIVGSEIYKNPKIIDHEDEEIKLRKEYNKQKSQRYRDRKRAANFINLQADKSSKIVSKCDNFHKSQISDPSTRNLLYIPTLNTADLLTGNEPNILESHSDYDDDIHNDTVSQVKNGPQYIDITTNAIVGPEIYKNSTVTVEEDEEIKRRKEYNKQKSQRYRDRKRATNFINLQADQSTKIVVNHVFKYPNFHKSQFANPSTRDVSYIPTFNTADLLTRNEPNIPESHSDYDDDIHNDTLSQVENGPQYRDITTNAIVGSEIYKNPTITIEEEEIKRRKEYNKQKSQRYRERKRAANSNNLQTDQSSKTDIYNDTLSQVKNVPQYRDKNNKTTDMIVGSHIYKNRITIEEDEEIKRRKEYNKQKSQRYRDRKRATNFINLQTDQSLKTVVNHVSKCQDNQTAVPSTINVPYVPPPIHTADLSTLNEPYIPESHSDYDDTSSQVSQLYEPIITIYVPNTQNLHDLH